MREDSEDVDGLVMSLLVLTMAGFMGFLVVIIMINNKPRVYEPIEEKRDKNLDYCFNDAVNWSN